MLAVSTQQAKEVFQTQKREPDFVLLLDVHQLTESYFAKEC
jgi:hypothetical protein